MEEIPIDYYTHHVKVFIKTIDWKNKQKSINQFKY